MFKKVLIANRGEIAVRVIRACRDLQISPVAVYSEPDRAALHVRMADEAYPIGPAASTDSYLAVEKIIEAARRGRCDAIHPGYGFLSENPSLAEACSDAGITLVGPRAASMRLMASKTGARSVLVKSGVPLVPGTYRALTSIEEAVGEAARIGYPVMMKAVAGGGGKGMRLVHDPARLPSEFEAASSEAKNAFGDSSVYLEKYIARPRHIEIQVLVDRHGNGIHLGERECSLQRRHQKVLEESPSTALTPDLRAQMGEAALKVARAAGYENAGTVEFLMDDQRKFYFLEMNTRLQVEHPVTEAVTGVDIVCEQFRIATGERLSMRQEDVAQRGWALECRVYAEDPDRHFLPSPGRILRLVEPQGPGIRVDSGVYPGWDVPIHYDPLIAKLVAQGADRSQAIARMKRAIGEYRIDGIKTNLGFFVRLLDDPDFVAGALSTGFIDEFLRRRPDQREDAPMKAVAVASALAYRDSQPLSQASDSEPRPRPESAWKTSLRPGIHSSRRRW